MNDVKAESRLATVVYVVGQDYAAGPLEVVINQGARHGVTLGDRFLVFGVGPHITDPTTGGDLGALELVRGQGAVVHVQESMSTIRSVERRRTRPAKRIIRNSPVLGSVGYALVSSGGGLGSIFASSSDIIEEELAPETEVPFESVQLGDLAKPI